MIFTGVPCFFGLGLEGVHVQTFEFLLYTLPAHLFMVTS